MKTNNYTKQQQLKMWYNKTDNNNLMSKKYN